MLMSSCQTVGIIESNDPKVKIRDGYQLLLNRRSMPALRLFSEAYEITKNGTDESLTAKALVALGDVYKYKDDGAQSENTYNVQKSISSYEEAANILIKLKYNQRLSMAYWGIAQAYAYEKNTSKSCNYINKAAQAYYQPSGGNEDQLNQNVVAAALPYFEFSKSKKFKADCSLTGK